MTTAMILALIQAAIEASKLFIDFANEVGGGGMTQAEAEAKWREVQKRAKDARINWENAG